MKAGEMLGLKDDLFKKKPSKGLASLAIDRYLRERKQDDDRAHHVNSPSQAGNCNRQNYYARIGVPHDSKEVDPRSERIFDNGDDVHDRIQGYLEEEGTLLIREAPLRNDKHNVQGHSDGLMWDREVQELVVLEIKSANDNNYSKVKKSGVHEKYIKQGNVYCWVFEQHRKYLRKTYPTKKALLLSVKKRKKYYASLYQHLEDGPKYTKEEKIEKKVQEHLQVDNILWKCKNPIHRISFVYEDKNDQEIKEIIMELDKSTIKPILKKYDDLERAIEIMEAPPREGKSPNDPICRWCPFLNYCWNIDKSR